MKNAYFAIKAYLIPLLVLVVIVLIVPYLLVPQLRSIKEQNQIVNEKGKRLRVLNEKLEKLNKIDEEEESVMLLEAEKAVPSDKKVASLVLGIDNLARQSNLLVNEARLTPGRVATDSATPSAKAKSVKKEPNELIVSLKLGGNLDSLQQFLKKLEYSKRLIKVLTVKTSQDQSGGYQFSLTLSAPFRNIKSKGDIVGTPLPEIGLTQKKFFAIIKSVLADVTSIIIPKGPTGNPDPFSQP